LLILTNPVAFAILLQFKTLRVQKKLMIPDLRFTIDPVESNKTGTLAITPSRPLTFELMREQLLHKELLQLLFNQEVNYNTKIRSKQVIGRNTSISTFHVGYLVTTRVLELLVACRVLYFNSKLLVCDLASSTELYYLIEKQSEADRPKIRGKLRCSGEEFDLTDCDFIFTGTHHYYIRGISLKQITTEISGKDIRQLYFSPDEVLLSQIQKNYGDEDHADQPQLVYSQGAEEALQKDTQPFPFLVLTDRLGAFANLWMNYPIANSESRAKVAYHDPSSWVKDARGKSIAKRQVACEKEWEQDLLETDFSKKITGTTHYYCPVDCVAKSLTFLLEVGWHIEDCNKNQICRLTESQLQISSQAESFLVRGKLQYDNYDVDLKDVVGAFNRKDRFIQLGNNRVGLLPQGLDSYGLNGLMEEGEIVQEGIKLHRNRVGSLSELFDSTAKITYDATFANLKEKLLTFKGLKEALPTPSFKGVLRSYQQEGVNWLSFLHEYGFHGLLADDMGLGKTVQVLAFLSRLNCKNPILIVLPTSLIFNWKREIEHFLPDANVFIYQGAQRSRWTEQTGPFSIILTSYPTLRIDAYLFQQHQFECVILDEAQTIKNANTATAQAIYKLQARFRLSLTGTPIENHLSELWAHFHFLMPDLFGEQKTFLGEVEAGQSDFRFMQRIRKKLRPFMLRRKKEEVAKDLPERIEQVVWVELPAAQRKVYEDFLAGFRTNLLKKVELDGIGKHRIEVLEAILRLRQICCHPVLVSGQSEEVASAPSGKFEALLQDLETAVEEGRKVLVYSQFTSMLQIIANEAKASKWPFVYLDGQTKDREGVVKQFQEDPKTFLFLISLKAGGIGLNLTAADYVFLYDPWWNEAVENQAIDRAHRIGRKDTVIAKRYVAIETVEEKMMTLKASKRSLMADVMEDNKPITQLTIDDLHYLLE
jgi:superfamily II DNA or RNA helicase